MIKNSSHRYDEKMASIKFFLNQLILLKHIRIVSRQGFFLSKKCLCRSFKQKVRVQYTPDFDGVFLYSALLKVNISPTKLLPPHPLPSVFVASPTIVACAPSSGGEGGVDLSFLRLMVSSSFYVGGWSLQLWPLLDKQPSSFLLVNWTPKQ